MCGIIGYVGKQSAGPILLEGLRRLEYRGYDSAGIALLDDGALQIRKKTGRIDAGLAPLVGRQPVHGSLGVGHTRWATHGHPSDENSHPHLDASGKIAVVHNGVIENYDRLRQRMSAEGHHFKSETDTEVLAHLIGEHYTRLCRNGAGKGTNGEAGRDSLHPLAAAVTSALADVIGAYGIAVVCTDYPGIIVGARRGSPLIIGIGDGEHFLSSDVTAIAPHTRQVVYLQDYDVVTLDAERFTVASQGMDGAKFQISQIEFDPEAAERGCFPHYMLKEIFEQPRTVTCEVNALVDATPISGPACR